MEFATLVVYERNVDELGSADTNSYEEDIDLDKLEFSTDTDESDNNSNDDDLLDNNTGHEEEEESNDVGFVEKTLSHTSASEIVETSEIKLID